MKLTLILVVLSTCLYAESIAQKVTLSFKNVPLEKVFQEINKQTSFRFLYSDDMVKDGAMVSIHANELPLEDVLRELMSSQKLDYRIVAKTVAISKKTNRKVAVVAAQQAVSGLITDNEGHPLVGVSIKLKDRPTVGTSTDINGRFILDVGNDAVLLVSYVGYKAQEIVVGGQNNLAIIMEPLDGALEEVVVVAFGTQKKLTSIGSQSTVSPTELKTPVRNLSTVLAGRLSGIVAVQRSGEPGYDNANVWIRGVSSLTGSSSPLVLVDGVERPFADIDPEDIETFSILKDASATAVYGVRGANGVILINTRKGKAGRVRIVAGYNQAINEFTKIPDLIDGPRYMEIVNEAHTTRGRNIRYTDDVIEKTRNQADPELYPNVNWFREIFNDFGHNKRMNLNMNGGSERASFYVSAAYYNEVGLFKRDKLQAYNSQIAVDRYNFTSNISIEATPTTKVDLGVQGFILDGNYPGRGTGDIFGVTMQTTPILFPKMYSNGYLADTRIGNPYAMLTQSGYVNEMRNRVNSNLKATQDLSYFTKGLSAYAMFAFDYYNSTAARRTKNPDTFHATGRDADGALVFNQTYVGTPYLGFQRTNQTSNRRFYTEAAINYSRQFGNHDVSGLLLFNQSDYVDNWTEDFILALPTRYRGLAGRATYGFDNRYLLEANFGYNGSENFLPNRRFGFFPSIGLGWVLSEESFFEPIKDVFPLVKFRFSSGQVGNSDIGGRRFAYIGTVGSGSGNYQFGQDYRQFDGLDIGEYAVDVSWEKSTKTNLGIDLNMLDNDLNIQFDLFHERREGSFLRRAAVPAFVGLLNSPYGNLGITENKGLDASLTYRGQISNDFSFNFQGTVTYNKNEIIEDDLPEWNYPWRERKGQIIGQRFGLVAEGLFVDEAEIASSARQTGDVKPGDIRYRDLNEDGVIDANDEAPIGYGAIPRLVYGARLGFEWKNFAVAGFFQGIGNVDILLNGEGLVPFQEGGDRGNLFTAVEDRWTEENPNPNAFYPRLTFGNENMNYNTSSWWVKNGSFLRLKTLDVSYTIPQRLSDRAKLKSATIYFQGFNLLTFSSFKLWDVEMGNGRGTSYPQLRTYSMGVQLTF